MGKVKSKPHWDIISYPTRWLLSKEQKMINVGEDAKNVEPFCTANGNIKSCRNYGKLCEESTEN